MGKTMKTIEEIIRELFWADEDGVVRLVSHSAGIKNLRRAVEQVVAIREE